jgi:hypothetical protein
MPCPVDWLLDAAEDAAVDAAEEML